MGQQIPQNLRSKILRISQVKTITDEHVFLNDGRVLDPVDFIIDERKVGCVMKLLECTCTWKSHEAGTHVVVPGVRRTNAAGTYTDEPGPVPFCKKGRWTLEEVTEKMHSAHRDKSTSDENYWLFPLALALLPLALAILAIGYVLWYSFAYVCRLLHRAFGEEAYEPSVVVLCVIIFAIFLVVFPSFLCWPEALTMAEKVLVTFLCAVVVLAVSIPLALGHKW